MHDIGTREQSILRAQMSLDLMSGVLRFSEFETLARLLDDGHGVAYVRERYTQFVKSRRHRRVMKGFGFVALVLVAMAAMWLWR